MSNIMTKAKFAELKGVHRSTVNKWANAGRIVLAENKKVLVAESNALLEKTQGHRHDVVERHIQEKKTQEEPEQEVYTDLNGLSRQDYQAMSLDAQNKVLKLKEALKVGKVLDKVQFKTDISKLGNNIKNALERLADNLAPQLASLSCQKTKVTKIKQETKKLMQELS